MDPFEHLRMVKDRAVGILPRPDDIRRIRALRGTAPGFDRAVWRAMCGRGVLGMRIPEESGGSGLDMRAFRGLAEEFGSRLTPEPLIQAAMAAELLPADHLPAVLSGDRIVLPAWQEHANSITTAGDTVLRDGRLTGRKMLIPMAAGADAFLVTVPGGLALVERTAPGLHLDIQPTPDGGNVGTLTLDNAPAEPIDGDPTDALDAAIMATAAYLLGLSDRAYAVTREVMQTQARLGRTNNALPALSRHIGDIEIQLSLTRTVVDAAAHAIDTEGWRPARQAAVSRAKVRAAEAAIMVTRACVQLHGDLGNIGTADIGLFQRKAMVLAPLYGAASVHRARFRAAAPESADE